MGSPNFDHTIYLGERRDRIRVRDTGGPSTTPRSRLNFIEGTGVTITVTDDAANDEVDITISTAGGDFDDPGKYIIRGWDYVDSAATDYPTTGFSLGKVPLGSVSPEAGAVSAMVNGQVRAWPFIVGRTGDIDTIEFDVVGTAGTTARASFAIYENASRTRLYPTTRVVGTGEVDVSGAAALKVTAVSATLTKGTLYWAAYNTNSATPSIRTLSAASQFSFCDTNAAAATKMQLFNAFTFDRAYEVLPTSFYAAGTGTAGASAVALLGIVPFVAIHYTT